MRTTFKIVKWLLKTLFLIIGSFPVFKCGSADKDGEIKFNGEVITDKNFIKLSEEFAKDSTTAYYKSRSFSYADVPTFEAVDEHYAKDKNKVFYCDEYREGQNYYMTKRQTILEVKPADPASFVSLKNGYARDNKNAWFNGTYFKVKDVASLVSIDSHFAKDDESAYLNLHPIVGSDGKTFELIDRNFAKDSVNIYYYGYTGEGQNNICILPCDRKSFQILDYRYSKDARKVFFLGFQIKGVDGSTFTLLTEDYTKDGKAVYFLERKIEGGDPESFEVYKENGEFGHDFDFARDKNFVYMDDQKMKDADVATFKVLGENYGSDKTHVYYKTKIVKNADPSTFQVYPHDFGNADSEDAINKFHEGVLVTD